jgi:Ca2+:H+ antiporter
LKQIAVEHRPHTHVHRKIPLYRKSWRAVFLLFFVPLLHPELITSLVPALPQAGVIFIAGGFILYPFGTVIEYVTEDFAEMFTRRMGSKSAGQLIGGLIHDFCTSAAYLTLTIATLLNAAQTNAQNRDELVTIVQISIAGAIITNVLFNNGVAFAIGSFRFGRLNFSKEYANQYSEMLFISVAVLALPSIASQFNIAAGNSTFQFKITRPETLALSNVTAIVLIFIYACYLGWTVLRLGDRQGKTTEEAREEAIEGYLREIGRMAPAEEEDEAAIEETTGEEIGALALELKMQAEQKAEAAHPGLIPRRKPVGVQLAELAGLVVAIAGVVFVSETMAHNIESGLVHGFHLNLFLIGFIIVPVATSLVELTAAISHARHNQIDSTLAVTTGSAVQTAMFVAPILVLVGHVVNLPGMTLEFGLFVLGVFALVSYLFEVVTQDGETTWFEGAQLLGVFAAIAAVAYFAGPGSQ